MSDWPPLSLAEWRDTHDTLHLWTQIVGKIRLALTPVVNHWWNVPLYISARGLTTSSMPYRDRAIDIEFDFLDHLLHIRTSDGGTGQIPLAPRSVAEMYAEIFRALRALDVDVKIWRKPSEIADAIPFDEDTKHHSYDPDPAQRCWRVLALSDAVFTEFRSRFLGKCSPVHFFWGGFDLAVTRFSGRLAPPREGADSITREAYSHEVSSVGFWPGDERLGVPTFYSYAAPEPAGYRDRMVSPAAAYYNEALGGFYLHYDDMRSAPDPARALLEFCQSTYDAAADTGQWDRAALERR